MSITLFKDVTTEEIISSIEEKGRGYTGLYVDMENPPERKYVKGMAAEINSMLKVLDRSRIDKKKEFSAKIEAEAESIRLRLEEANRPFTILIDDYNKKRAEILAEQKREREAKELAEQVEKDHEFALLIDSQMVAERKQREKEKAEYEQKLKDDAAAKAIEDHKLEIERQEQQRINEENARLANREHLATINSNIVNQLRAIGLDNEQAKKVVIAIAKGEINNVSINY